MPIRAGLACGRAVMPLRTSSSSNALCDSVRPGTVGRRHRGDRRQCRVGVSNARSKHEEKCKPAESVLNCPGFMIVQRKRKLILRRTFVEGCCEWVLRYR